MATSTKALAMVRTLKEAIGRRLPTYVLTQSVDANGNPTLLVSADSAPAAGEQVALLRVRPVDLIFTNSVGQTQENFAPHFVEMCLETSSVASVALLTEANQAAIKGEVLKQSGIFIAYLLTNGTVPALASVDTQMVAANQVATFELDPSFRLMGA